MSIDLEQLDNLVTKLSPVQAPATSGTSNAIDIDKTLTAKEKTFLKQVFKEVLPLILKCNNTSFDNSQFKFSAISLAISPIEREDSSSKPRSFFAAPKYSNIEKIKDSLSQIFDEENAKNLEEKYEQQSNQAGSDPKKIEQAREKEIESLRKLLFRFEQLEFGGYQLKLSVEGLARLLTHIKNHQEKLQQQPAIPEGPDVKEDNEKDNHMEVETDSSNPVTTYAPPESRQLFENNNPKALENSCRKWCDKKANEGFSFEDSRVKMGTTVLMKVEGNKLKCKEPCDAFYKATTGIIKSTKTQGITIRRGTEEQRSRLLQQLLSSNAKDDLRITLVNQPLGEDQVFTLKQYREQVTEQQDNQQKLNP